VPEIAFISLAILLISWMANTRLPFGVPGGLFAVIVGVVVGGDAYFVGWSEVVQAEQVSGSFAQSGLQLLGPGGEVGHGLIEVAPLLVTTSALGIYNFVESMDNRESAAAAGETTICAKFSPLTALAHCWLATARRPYLIHP
jgi:AGZA family xanthine/uracil permease-like MFS transporter